jgi:hypothetical protein
MCETRPKAGLVRYPARSDPYMRPVLVTFIVFARPAPCRGPGLKGLKFHELQLDEINPYASYYAIVSKRVIWRTC